MSFDEDRNRLNRLEELKNSLFSKNFKVKIEHHDTFSTHEKREVPDSWERTTTKSNLGEKIFMKTSVFKKFFIASIFFFVLAVGYAAYMFLAGGNTVSNDNIEISVLGNAFTAGGEELPLQISVINKNNSALELVDLIIEYPKSSSEGLPEDKERIRQSLGAIPGGGIRNENVKLTLFGEQGSTRSIKISIEYRVEGSNAIFIKEKLYNVSISSSPIDLIVEGPTEISPNQDVNLTVKTTLNATKKASDMLLRIDYPVGFKFVEATPKPAYGNNVWDLGDLAPGALHDIAIVGKMVDVFDGEDKTFRIWSGSQSDTDKAQIGIVFNSLGHTVSIKKPFIEARLLVNGIYQSDYSVDSKGEIRGDIEWVNNLDTKVNDLKIQAKISGNSVDRKTIASDTGFYSSSTDTIIWDKNSNSELIEVNSGDAGSVSFSFSPISSLSSNLITDPSVTIEVSISAKQPTEGNVLKELKNSEIKVVKIISDIGLAAKALYFSGPFSNTGPIPPKVEQETTYTVVWTITNTSNNISKASVRSTLPPWVKFVGNVSPSSEDVSYNASTKEIIWNVGKIPKGTGISTAGREVAFKISFLPSLSQVNNQPVIINDAVLTGFDDFANVNVRVNKNSLNTRLANDPLFPEGGDRVTE